RSVRIPVLEDKDGFTPDMSAVKVERGTRRKRHRNGLPRINHQRYRAVVCESNEPTDKNSIDSADRRSGRLVRTCCEQLLEFELAIFDWHDSRRRYQTIAHVFALSSGGSSNPSSRRRYRP